MMRFLGLVVLGLAFRSFDCEIVAGCKDVKDSNEFKKFEIPKAAVAGQMKHVDVKNSRITMIVKQSGEERAFTVDKETKFIGPRGGISEERLKDDRLDTGYEVHVLGDKTGSVAREVYLPFRKLPMKKDKKPA